MRRTTTLSALALTAVLALGACGGDEEPTDPATPPEETTSEEMTSEEMTDEEMTDEEMTDEEMTSEEMTDEEMTDEEMTSEMPGDDEEMTSMGPGAAGDACTTFFTEGGPLADRATAAREALTNGEVTDAVALSEVSLLEARIAELVEGADAETATLLEEVNAPFSETVTAANTEGAVDAETGEITLPEIDVTGSEEAQSELEAACQG